MFDTFDTQIHCEEVYTDPDQETPCQESTPDQLEYFARVLTLTEIACGLKGDDQDGNKARPY